MLPLAAASKTDQVLGRGVAVLVGDVLTQPVPQWLDRHQVRTVARQRGMRVTFRLAAADQIILAR